MKTLWLPGAVGSSNYWRETATCMRAFPGSSQIFSEDRFLSWPGLGCEPGSTAVRGLSDLVQLVLSEMDQPVNIVAQSMGGYVALKAALAAPNKISRLVLAATSAGLEMSRFGASDWREDYFKTYPDAARWIGEPQDDLSQALPSLELPTLLLWGGEDCVSPVPVGEKLAELMPNASLAVIEGGKHDFALTHAPAVAVLIAGHLVRADELGLARAGSED